MTIHKAPDVPMQKILNLRCSRLISPITYDSIFNQILGNTLFRAVLFISRDKVSFRAVLFISGDKVSFRNKK